MEPMSQEESRNLLIILFLLFAVVNSAALFPEIVKCIRLLTARYRHKKQYIKKMLANNPPPRATFFGRTDGKYILVEGPYEDKYLSKWKRRMWKQNKKKRPQIADKNSKMN